MVDVGEPADFCIIARFQARREAKEELAEAFREMLPQVRSEEGCLAIDVFRAARVPRLFYIHSRWRDEAAFDRHAEMPHTLRFIERAQRLMTHELKVIRTRRLE